MIKARLRKLKDQFVEYNLDGYVIPKNDEFFSEYSDKDRLGFISNFKGSAGYAIILKNKNYLFVDGRYTLQAKIESGKNFRIIDYKEILDTKIFKNLNLGIDPKLFTSDHIRKFFLKNNRVTIINENLVDNIFKPKEKKIIPFYSLDKKVTGENHLQKIQKILSFLRKERLDNILISAPENVAWLLNIRGYDSPSSPIPNCHLVISKKREIYLIVNKKKSKNLIKENKLKKNQIIEPKNLSNFFDILNGKNISIDRKTCSIYFEQILKKRFKIIKKEDPIYFLKSIKNKEEIKNMINSHIIDGVALTKFIYWIKKLNKRKITEYEAQKKLESFRKLNKNYLYPSFNTIAGSGENGAIVHHRAKKKKSKIIRKGDIFLCDSGGQYRYGTTDVTRTICFRKPSKVIKDIFTRVLKGHIAVATTNINSCNIGSKIDKRARKYLKKINLDYQHGTGHGVGFFLNVHEGPQGISKYNNVKMFEGMVLSNEPGFYKKGKFGIRIENLMYVKKVEKKKLFENLTLAPIDKELVNFNQLTKSEKNYLSNYHMKVYTNLFKFLRPNEKKWLAGFI